MTVARLLMAGVLMLAASNAAWPQAIGKAEKVERQASRTLVDAKAPLRPGDDLLQDMKIETEAASSAGLRFADTSVLNIGPASRVTLDRYVFSGERRASALAVNLLQGGFRFVSGASGKRAYDIRTPHAVIGLRGTTIGFIVTATSTTVILKQGAATACLPGRRSCRNLARPDQIVVISATGTSRAAVRRRGDPDFADWCRGGGAACGL